jgi:hypothetical protein
MFRRERARQISGMKRPRRLLSSCVATAIRSVLCAPHTVPNEVLYAARARTGATSIAALSGELLAPLDLGLERWLTHEASLAFLTANRH